MSHKICRCGERYAENRACRHNSAEPCEREEFFESHKISSEFKKKGFTVGDAVTVYNRYLFAVPVSATVVEIREDLPSLFAVKLVFDSRNPGGTNVTKHDGKWFSENECRIAGLVKDDYALRKSDGSAGPLPMSDDHMNPMKSDAVNHPSHYGGGDNPYEAIKVIEAWQAGFCIGSALKYLCRLGKKDPEKEIEDAQKAIWYVQRHIERLRSELLGLDQV